jgi:hypothetical protein
MDIGRQQEIALASLKAALAERLRDGDTVKEITDRTVEEFGSEGHEIAPDDELRAFIAALVDSVPIDEKTPPMTGD